MRTCMHTRTHTLRLSIFFVSFTNCVAQQYYSSYSCNLSLRRQLLSSKSEPCFSTASSAWLINLSSLLTVCLPFLNMTVAFAFLIDPSLTFTFQPIMQEPTFRVWNERQSCYCISRRPPVSMFLRNSIYWEFHQKVNETICMQIKTGCWVIYSKRRAFLCNYLHKL